MYPNDKEKHMRWIRILVIASAAVMVTAGTAQAQKFDYQGPMTGPEVVPGPGDPDGTGTHKVRIDSATNELCYELTWESIDQPDAAHIHIGGPDEAGRIMVDLDLGANGPKACMPVDSTSVNHMTGSPKAHYVDLHNPAFPEGAIRGQMER